MLRWLLPTLPQTATVEAAWMLLRLPPLWPLHVHKRPLSTMLH